MKRLTILLLFCIPTLLFGQLKPIGSWTDHLPYQRGTSLTINSNQLFCATKTGIFIYNIGNQSITRWSKVNILNDVAVDQIKFVHATQTLIVIYENANIDLIKNGSVFNIPFVKDNSRVTNKLVNEIKVYNNLAYISYGFGIVVLDTDKNEIKDSYLFGQNGNEISVNSTLIVNQTIYAATRNGLYQSNLSSNLLDFSNWNKVSFKSTNNFKKLFSLGQKNLAVIQTANSDSVFNLTSFTPIPQLSNKSYIHLTQNQNEISYISNNTYELYDTSLNIIRSFGIETGNLMDAITYNSKLYVLNTFHPLLIFDESGANTGTIKPNGPFERNVFDIEAKDGTVWAVTGGHDFTYNNSFSYVRAYQLKNNRWTSYIEFLEPSLNGIYDVLSVNINPNNSDQVYFGTWGFGLLEWNQSTPFIQYFDNGTSLTKSTARNNWIGIGETELDENNNLWMVNTYTKNCLVVKKNNGNWNNFNFSQYISSDETAAKELLITSDNHKWIALPTLNEIIVFDDNGTIDNKADDRSVILRQETGQGSIPGIRGITMEQDKNGTVWIGTSDGIAVYYSPERVFESGQRDADRILIDDGENVEILLENVGINDIEIDGSNQKWIATVGSGVYLLSEDGQQLIHHFTKENSPLVSNNILSISVDDLTGEVYFATGQGIVSYRGNAIAGSDDLSNIKIFPNPVKPDYQGPISISGLMTNSTVKITNISGALVNEIISEGGQVLWNGTNFSGEEVSTGVYLLFISAENEDESLKTEIGKILYTR